MLMLLCNVSLQAQQKDSIGLQNAVNRLHLALVMKNNKAIKKLVSQRIQYAHSNGWIETRKEMIQHLKDGTLSYKSIKLDHIETAIDGHGAGKKQRAICSDHGEFGFRISAQSHSNMAMEKRAVDIDEQAEPEVE
jgi:hypothetical protein